MITHTEIQGDLIQLALEGQFDVIAHGCNCFCTMKSGIAPQMANTFGCDKYDLEYYTQKGNINKLGQIEHRNFYVNNGKIQSNFEYEDINLIVVNAYTQFMYGTNHKYGVSKPLDYEALTLCLRKMNTIFKGKHIGLPLIGCGLAGGIWDISNLPETNQAWSL